MSRPETPKTSVATLANLILAVSNNFSRRLRSAVRLSTSLRRYRVKSRGSRMGEGGTKLGRSAEDNPSGGLVLTSYENRVTTTVLPIDIENAHHNKPELTFKTAAGQHLLSRIQTADNIFNIPISKSTSTTVLANNAKPSFGSPGSK